MSEVTALSVTQLARRMRNVLEIEVGEIWVEGEISNLRKQASGHWYFSIKDEGAQLSCAMFGARSRPGSPVLADGAKVKVFGEVSFYEARGQAQLIVTKAQAAGVGDLQARFEALKQKLQAEGLFESTRKKKLPTFPRVIALVTSPTGAALQDMLHVFERRSPWVKLVLYPTAVQGKGAEQEIARALARVELAQEEGLPVADLVIVGRGGGSIEDLWNFNEEVVARAIAACTLPVISAVGHEIDFTIADFVADLRAPTPSAAAEMATPDREELEGALQNYGRRLQRCASIVLEREGAKLMLCRQALLRYSGERLMRERVMRLDDLRQRLGRSWRDREMRERAQLAQMAAIWARYRPEAVVREKEEGLLRSREKIERLVNEQVAQLAVRLERQRERLQALAPQRVLERGYAIVTNEEGEVITDPGQVSPGERLKNVTQAGVFFTTVEE